MKIVDKDEKQFVFDIIRKKYILYTPEEKVRQHIVHWMINELKYPKSSLSIEKSFTFNNRIKRYDIVVYKNNTPWILVECKSQKIKITQDTFDQAGKYNIALRVPYLFITNHLSNYIVQVDFEKNQFHFLNELPAY